MARDKADIIREQRTIPTRDEIVYHLIDTVNSSLIYEGRNKQFGADTSEATWQIKRTLIQGTLTTTAFADDGNYTQVWDNRNALFSPGAFFSQLSTDFDGVNDHVNFGDIYNYSPATAFSIGVWIKPQNFSALRYIISNITLDANVYGWRIGINTSGQIVTQTRSPGGTYAADTFTTALVADTWTHLIWTWAGSSNKSGQKVFIDAVQDAFTPGTGALGDWTNSTYPLTLGNTNNTLHFVGNMFHLSIWDKALSQAEVTEIYNGGNPPDLRTLTTAGNLKSWWRLGDGDAFPTVLDTKGVANGTMTNMTSADFESDVP